MVGPVFIPESGSEADLRIPVLGKNQIPIPTHFSRIHARQGNGRLEVISLLVSNQPTVHNDIQKYLTSIGRIEAASGIRFSPMLSAQEGERIRAEIPSALWRLK